MYRAIGASIPHAGNAGTLESFLMSMKVVLTNPQTDATCAWCEKPRECLTATFGDRFLVDAQLCLKCLQQAIKLRAKQTSTGEQNATKTAARQAESPAKE